MPEQRTADGVQLRERIQRYLRESGLAGRNARAVPLTSDASDRRYFRIIAPDGPSIVLALHAGAIDFATLPFASVSALLQQIPLPVPGILGHSDELGILALQDLGDVTLQAHLGAATPAEHAALYRQAVALVEKLTWELEFFIRHFVCGYRGVVLTDTERSALADEWAVIATELAAEPPVLCHRDYHSRNLMLREGSLYIIDFQDARMGPDTYDLVSLLRDSYVDITDRELDELIAYFLALRQGTGVVNQTDSLALSKGPGVGVNQADSHPLEFRRRFDLMALQRNLKALGTFGYQTITRHNPVYIQYMPRTLRYARRNLEKYPRFERLRSLLA